MTKLIVFIGTNSWTFEQNSKSIHEKRVTLKDTMRPLHEQILTVLFLQRP